MNNYSKRFHEQWSIVRSYIESCLLEQIDKSLTVDYVKANGILESEIKDWRNPYEERGRFAADLKKTNPAAAEEFMRRLDSVKISSGGGIHRPSSMPAMTVSAAIGVGSYVLLRFAANSGVAVSCLAGTILLGLTYTIMSNRARENLRGKLKANCASCLKQLDSAEEELIRLLEQAEGTN